VQNIMAKVTDPDWLAANLKTLDSDGRIQILLVCGKVAQATYQKCGFQPKKATVIEMPHPAARLWSKERIAKTSDEIRKAVDSL